MRRGRRRDTGYPAVEVWVDVPGRPWDLSPEVLRDFSDLLHAVHAANGTGGRRPTRSGTTSRRAWTVVSPLRAVIKWRVSTLAGFEGGTRIYLNTIDPWTLAARVRDRLVVLQPSGVLGDVRLG